jgi:hypothetical protein
MYVGHYAGRFAGRYVERYVERLSNSNFKYPFLKNHALAQSFLSRF